VVETSIGLDRMFLLTLCAAYQEEAVEGGEVRTVLKLHPALAPVKAAILPLVKKDGLPEMAEKIYNDLRFDFKLYIEDKDSIGKRYRRMDAIGTPFCITVDHESLTNDDVTIRHRDTMEQRRVKVAELRDILNAETSLSALLKKLA
jgi:glycyl-tRNA synthetase